MKPTLPQNDPHPELRTSRFASLGDAHVYAYDRFNGVATDASRPMIQSPRWLALYIEKALDTTANSKRVTASVQANESGRPSFLSQVKQLLKTDVSELPGMIAEGGADHAQRVKDVSAKIAQHGIGWVFDQMKAEREASPLVVRAQDVSEIEALYASIEAPGVVASYHDDAVFARMRVAGPNPMMIERMTEPDARFPVTYEQFQSVMGEWDDMDMAMSEGRVYLEDLTHLAGMEAGTLPHGQKYLPAPFAMFAVPRGKDAQRSLRPIAIQCEPVPGPDNPVITPGDGIAWLMAKTALTVADGNMHQAVSHLGRTHLVMTPFIMATNRCLAKNHPVRCLLHSHFEGTLGINKMADEVLCKAGGGVDSMLALTIEGSREAAAQAAREWDFNARMIRPELAARGVDDPTVLPDYPYRDDGLLVWDAIHEWITAFVRLYYESDADIAEDPELTAWAAEIVASDGGRINGFGEGAPGRIQTREYLADAITQIIFTAGPQHSAVNFPQYESMTYVANYPLALSTPSPTRVDGYEMADYLAMLPTLDMAQYQLNFGYLMGTLRYLKLGDYPGGPFSILLDDRVKAPLAEFKARLQGVERTIRGRNQCRPTYAFLMPSLITHSLNI